MLKKQIPILSVGIRKVPSTAIDIDEELLRNDDLFDEDEIKTFSEVAHLNTVEIDGDLVPANTIHSKVNSLNVIITNNQKVLNMDLVAINTLYSTEFEVEYVYDSTIGRNLPKYIIIN